MHERSVRSHHNVSSINLNQTHLFLACLLLRFHKTVTMEMSEVIVHHDLQRTVDILARALHHHPLGRYLQLDTYRLPNSTIIDLEQSRKLFNDLVLELHFESAVLAQLQDGGAVSVW